MSCARIRIIYFEGKGDLEIKRLVLIKIEIYNNPLFGRFSISSEILIDFGLTLFTVLAFPADTL